MKTALPLLFCIGIFASAFAQVSRLPINDGFEEDPNNFNVLGGTTYFIAYNNTYGYELYKSNGTPAGTQLAVDINPGSGSSLNGSQMVMFNNELYFFANDGTHGFEIWKSDGTPAGTQMIKDIYPGASSSNVYSGNTGRFSIAATNQYVFFWARDSATDAHYGLWRTDGTAAGTIMLAKGLTSSSTPAMLGNGNLVYFYGLLSNTIGTELCVSDGTPGGTVEIKDINPGTGGSSLNNITKFGSKVIFAATGPNGAEPYISDGTTAGTVLLKDIHPSTGSSPTRFYSFNGKVLFYANDSAHGIEPWVTDGTTGGTQLLVDITAGTASTNSTLPIVSNSSLAFLGGGGQFWATDGTPAGSYRYMNSFQPTTASSVPAAVYNGRVYFLVRNSTVSTDIWSTTTGFDTIRHTFYSTAAFNMVRLYAGPNTLFVVQKTIIDALLNLWKLDFGVCSPAANITGNVPLTCNSHTVTLNAGSFSSYVWSTGDTTAQITVSTPGTYIVNVFDTNFNCSSTDTVTVAMATSNVISVPLICGVTVDSATGKNLLVWNKHNDKTGEALFRIEREVTTNVFTPIADVPYDSLSAYLDTAANPQITSYRYRLILLDSCGNVSLPGTAHQTVHLSQNSGINNEVNLIWNSYAGTSYSQQNVQRSVNGGAWVNLATLPGGNTSYTDLTPPTGTLSYQIEVVIDSTCTPSRGAWGVFSNRIQYVATGIETVTAGSFGVYPNPVNGILHIQLPEGNYSGNILVTDATGKQVRHLPAGNRFMAEDMSGLAPGVYTLSHTEGAVKPTYFIKQ